MNKADFDRLLVQTLADRKLSQSEKRAPVSYTHLTLPTTERV